MTQFRTQGFTNPSYELVALYPEHFLPHGSVLPVHSVNPDPTLVTQLTLYTLAGDRRLRESRNGGRLPNFHAPERQNHHERVNVFLVILNAEIKFHRYLQTINQRTPRRSLPNDVLDLLHLTVQLVDLLYWKPVPREGSDGEALSAQRIESRRRNPPRSARPDPAMMVIETGSSEAREIDGLGDIMDVETRQAFVLALMSDHGAFPCMSQGIIATATGLAKLGQFFYLVFEFICMNHPYAGMGLLFAVVFYGPIFLIRSYFSTFLASARESAFTLYPFSYSDLTDVRDLPRFWGGLFTLVQ